MNAPEHDATGSEPGAHALSRRSALAAGAGGVAAAAVVAGASGEVAFAAPAPASFTPAQRTFTGAATLYRRRRFTRRRGRHFRVTGPGVRQRMRLVAVGDIASVAAGSQRSFELTFRSPVRGPAQGTYRLRRPGFAATDLFLVPVDPGHRTYLAVVNNR